MDKARNFRTYKVWQDAVDYAAKVYKVTAEMPWFEKKGLCDQLQRAVVSIGSNIAEGSAKPSDADFARFLDTALGSAYEVETQLFIANKVGYLRGKNENEKFLTKTITKTKTRLNENDNENEKLTKTITKTKTRLNENDNESVTYEELYAGIVEIEKQLSGLIRSLRK